MAMKISTAKISVAKISTRKIDINEYNNWLSSLPDNSPLSLLTELVEHPEVEDFCNYYLEYYSV